MKELKLILAFDVSKSELDYAYYDKNTGLITKEGRIKNDVKSIRKFLEKQDCTKVYIVFEPTGSYSNKLLCLCEEMGFTFSLINPTSSHYYSQAKGIITKTDAQAARTLAEMGATQNLAVYKPSSKENRKRKSLMKHVSSLKTDQRSILNRIHAEEQKKDPDSFLLASYQRLLKGITEEIETVSNSIKSIKEEAYEAKKKKGMTVVGIGESAADWMLTFSNGLTNFESGRALKKFFGIVPRTHTSGSSVRKNSGITKSGEGKVRGVLYMAALSAKRYNKTCKDLYERLRAKGKCHYKAIVAVMGKLVMQFYAVVTSDVDFDNDYHLKRAERKAAEDVREEQAKIDLAA